MLSSPTVLLDGPCEGMSGFLLAGVPLHIPVSPRMGATRRVPFGVVVGGDFVYMPTEEGGSQYRFHDETFTVCCCLDPACDPTCVTGEPRGPVLHERWEVTMSVRELGLEPGAADPVETIDVRDVR